jgi:GntR family transcriptional regulator, transcriptional repressor for pyruvate dehydrogenase complex
VTVWGPIKEAGSLTGRISRRIESIIVSEQLTVGQQLPPERELARLLGVSRPALREAVKTLEAHGRLVVRHGQGVFVGDGRSDPMRDSLTKLEVSLAELFAMREVLEGPAAEWAASRVTADEIERISEALLALKQAARTEPVDFGRLATLDAAFHLQIVEIAKNRFLIRTVGVLQEMLRAGMETTLTIPGRLGQSRRDHRAIFEAVRSGDPQAARLAAVAHIHGARDAALDRVRAERREAERYGQSSRRR